jgi:hypothetical protein
MGHRLRRVILSSGGILLFGLGILHLGVTPFINRFVHSSSRPNAADWLAPPMLLNHIIVGILLLPLGYLTVYAAKDAAEGSSWAKTICRATAVTVATLPITLLVLMGGRYDAPAFRIATGMVCLASVALLAASFWPQKTAYPVG